MRIALVNRGGRVRRAGVVGRDGRPAARLATPGEAGRPRGDALLGSGLAALPRLHAVFSAAWRTAGCGR
ncbi:MAG: hypothetical protein ABIZ05_07075 [Pseudonocardiaceae bacterium]